MVTIAPEVANLRVSPPRQRFEGELTKKMTRRLANGDHRARGRELTGVSTAPEVRGRAYGWCDHRARGSVRYTLFQQVNPIEHATIVSDQIGVESVNESSHRRTVTTKHYISYAILSANVKHRTLKSLAIMSPLGTVFVQEGAERHVTRRQTVRTEVFAAPVGGQVQRYPMFARFVAVVGVAHEGDRQSVYFVRQSIFGYDDAKDGRGVRIHRQ